MNFSKKIGILVILILFLTTISVIAKTEKITLRAGESFELEGKNISLVRSSENFMIVCVNGKKAIIR